MTTTRRERSVSTRWRVALHQRRSPPGVWCANSGKCCGVPVAATSWIREASRAPRRRSARRSRSVRPGSGGLACRNSSVSASLTSMPTGSCARNRSSRRSSAARACPLVRLVATGLVLVGRFCDEWVAKDDPFWRDPEFANLGFVAAGAGLEYGEGTPDARLLTDVLEQNDVVREM